MTGMRWAGGGVFQLMIMRQSRMWFQSRDDVLVFERLTFRVRRHTHEEFYWPAKHYVERERLGFTRMMRHALLPVTAPCEQRTRRKAKAKGNKGATPAASQPEQGPAEAAATRPETISRTTAPPKGGCRPHLTGKC